MNRTTIRIFAVTAFLAAFVEGNAYKWADAAPDTAEFTLVKKSGDIALYERWIASESNQSAREVKATFRIQAGATAAVNLLRDASRGRMWNKNTNAYKVVDVCPDSWVSYIQYDLPWPVSNQDCVLQYEATTTSDGILITFQATEHPRFPVEKRVQRIPGIQGKWIFKEVGDDVDVEYYITTTPSKSLPNWLTDPIIRNNLIDTVESFRSILETEVLSIK